MNRARLVAIWSAIRRQISEAGGVLVGRGNQDWNSMTSSEDWNTGSATEDWA